MTAVPETAEADDRIPYLGGVGSSEYNLRRRRSGDAPLQRIQIAPGIDRRGVLP